MDYEGIITNVDNFFCILTLEGDIKVHFGILLSQSPLHKLPGVGSRIAIQNSHRNRSLYLVCNYSVLQGNFDVENTSSAFVDIIQTKKLGTADLLMIYETVKFLDNNFDLKSNELHLLIVEIVTRLLEFCINEENCEHTCLNNKIAQFNIISVSSCRYIKVNTDKYDDFPHWSYGVHTKATKNTFVFGFLAIDPTYGFLMLKDSNYQMPCVVYNSKGRNIQTITSSYVLISKYKVFSEVFKEKHVPNLEYLLVDFEDVLVIHSKGNFDTFGAQIPTSEYSNSISFVVLKKGAVCFGNSNRPECWFQISVYNKNGHDVSEVIFLILPQTYVKYAMFLEESYSFKMFHNTPLKETNVIELSRLGSYKSFELTDDDAYFQKLDKVEEQERSLTLKECKQYVSSSVSQAKFISFNGLLRSKRFADSLPSRTKKRTTLYGFGTPGSKVHQLVFSWRENGTEKYLDCYLNNWENMLVPLGLIPQMHIIVKNVIPQSNKYLKSSAFTSFEIKAYEPVVDFSTVNLSENADLDWGSPSFLGLGNKLPLGVLIWGRVMSIQILSVKMSTICKTCTSTVECAGMDSHCNSTEKKTDFLIKLHVSDEYGQSKVLVKNPKFLKYILDLQEKQYELWKQGFDQMGQFSFSLFQEESQCETNDIHVDCFKGILTEYLKKFNECAIVSLDLKCRKLDSNPLRNGGRPLWFLVDARRN